MNMSRFRAQNLLKSDDPLSRQLYEWLGGKMFLFGLFAMMFAFIVRMVFLGKNSIYLDEAFSIHTAQRSVIGLIKRVSADNSPPLHYLLLHYWIRIFGTTEEATRLLSTMLNVLSIPVLIAIGRRFFSDKVAVYSVLLFITSDIYIYYSKEARTYTLVTLLTLLSFYYLFRLIESGTWKHAILLGLFNYLLIMSHYGIYVLFPLQGLAMLLYLPTHPRMFGRYFVGQLGMVMLFLPWYFYWQANISINMSWVPKPTLKFIRYVLIRFAGNTSHLAIFKWLFLLGLPITFGFRAWKGGFKWRRILVLILWGGGTFGLSILMSYLYKPSFRENYILFCLPAGFLLVAWIWAEFPLNGMFKTIVFGFAFILMVKSTVYNYQRDRHWREAVHSLENMASDNTLILMGRKYFTL
ncbi:MAG TPA: hypothetical protein ENJ82_13185, partial [Bacteroidetes bacterium]|nr:hypothetical protein [Bacteroidota bacterium]